MRVEPIRNKDKIQEIKDNLKADSYRNYILFTLGINTGLRVSDLLQLKVKEVKNNSHIRLTEKKTSKYKKQLINDQLKQKILAYIEDKNLSEEDYLFQSRKGNNKPISRQQAYRILKEAGKGVGLDQLGTHTLRKTFGYHFYQRTKDLATLQMIFNHNKPETTLDYIGITQDMIDSSIEDFIL